MTEEERSLQEVVADLPSRFLECRLGEHRWVRQGDPLQEGERGLYVIRWRCTGCKNKRYDRVTASGVLYARWYERPKGFDIKGFGHATRRKAVYRRALIEKVEESA